MIQQELNNLIDKVIGTKGNLKVPAFWMRKILKDLVKQNEITFYVDDIEYKALRGMTWYEYANSENNTDFICSRALDTVQYITEDAILNIGFGGIELRELPRPEGRDVIQPNGRYYCEYPE